VRYTINTTAPQRLVTTPQVSNTTYYNPPKSPLKEGNEARQPRYPNSRKPEAVRAQNAKMLIYSSQ